MVAVTPYTCAAGWRGSRPFAKERKIASKVSRHVGYEALKVIGM